MLSVARHCLSKVLEPEPTLPSFLNILSFCLAFLVLNNVFRLTPNLPNSLYYLAVITVNLLILLKVDKRDLMPSVPMWLFWGLMWLSIFMNMEDIPEVIRAPSRTMAFILVLLVAGPWFSGGQLNLVRERMFDIFNAAMLFMAVLSFLGKVFGFLPTDRQGYYLGCTYHSMNLGAIAGIAIIYSLHRAMNVWKNKTLRIAFVMCFVSSFLVMLLSSSRTVLVSCVIAALSYLGAGAGRNVGRFIKPAILLSLLLFCVSLIFPEYFHGLRSKSGMESSEFTMERFVSSRTSVWKARLEEIEESPLFGIGAHTVKGGRIADDGQIEPGNAWLFVFSSMGVFSFMLFFFMVFYGLRRYYRMAVPGRRDSLIMALLVYFCLYMIGESHITAAGEFTCMYFWLLLSVALFHESNNSINAIPRFEPTYT